MTITETPLTTSADTRIAATIAHIESELDTMCGGTYEHVRSDEQLQDQARQSALFEVLEMLTGRDRLTLNIERRGRVR